MLNKLRNKAAFADPRCLTCRWFDLCKGNFRFSGPDPADPNWRNEPPCYLTDKEIANPDDKIRWLERRGISADETLAVGGGYTDIPLLDWAKISVLLDKTGKKQKQYAHKIRIISKLVGVKKGENEIF